MKRETPSNLSPFFPSESVTDRKSNKKPTLGGGHTVASVLVDLLYQAGVREIFGVAGDALNGLTDTLRRDGRIAWIGCRHEENAAYAACAAAELTGRLGVCAGTVGPGALHLINGLYNAKREGAPVLAITGQVPTQERGTNYFQEVDLMKVFDDVCGFQATVSSPSQMLRMSELAIQKALGEKSVSRLEIPVDLMLMKIENLHYYHPIVDDQAQILPSRQHLLRATELIEKAKRPALLCGIGCAEARNETLELSERLNAPLAHTLRAKDIFEGRHRNVVGLTGLIGAPAGYRAVLDCDLLVMLGTNFPYENFLPVDVPIVQIDRKVENIGRRAPVTVGLVGDVKGALQELLPMLAQKPESEFLNGLRIMHDKTRERFRAQGRISRAAEPLHPALFAQAISEVANDDAVFTVDVGESTVWAARYLEMSAQRRLLGSFNHGSMGCALPLALGASSVNRDRQVWALCGDGGFAMAMQDFVTAVRFDWPVKIVVFNNSELGFVKMENEVSGFPLDPDATGLLNPHFAALAESCGALGLRVEHAMDIRKSLQTAVDHRGPVLIEAMVTPGELTLPPHIGWRQAWGFGLSKAKEGLLGLAGDHEQWENWKREFEAAWNK